MKNWIIFLLSIVAFFLPVGVFANGAAPADDITSTGFTINVAPITPGTDSIATGVTGGASGMASALILQITNILLVVMGSLGLVTMTIGGGYMIFSMGNEENLGKGKGIFTSGLIAIAIALSSYLIIAFVRYILYSYLG